MYIRIKDFPLPKRKWYGWQVSKKYAIGIAAHEGYQLPELYLNEGGPFDYPKEWAKTKGRVGAKPRPMFWLVNMLTHNIVKQFLTLSQAREYVRKRKQKQHKAQ